MTTFIPERYPAGHPKAGSIIPTAAEAAELALVAELDAMPVAPKPAPVAEPAPPRPAPLPDSLAGLLPTLPADPTRTSEDTPLEERPPHQVMLAGALLAGVIVILVALAAWSLWRSSQLSAASTPTATALATPLATPAATSAPTTTALPPDSLPRAIVGYFDFQDPGSAVPLERATHYQIVGRAGQQWLLVETDAGARVWVLGADIDHAVDQGLADLTPRRPQPAAVPAASAPAAPAAAAPCQTVEATHPAYDSTGTQRGYGIGVGCTPAEAAANAARIAAEMEATYP